MGIFPITICMSPCNVIVLVQRDTDMTLQSVLDPDGAQTRKSRRLKRRVHKNKIGVTKKYRSSLLLPLPILCRVQTIFDMLTVMTNSARLASISDSMVGLMGEYALKNYVDEFGIYKQRSRSGSKVLPGCC